MDIPDLNIFMMCKSMNKSAIREMPEGFHIRNCRKSELEIWKAIHFDDFETSKKYHEFMTNYYNEVYAGKGNLFFEKCLFACDKAGKPIGTCFIWKAYNRINTLHWFKVVKQHEGRGIGRALLSRVMTQVKEVEYPIYLHTQPSSFRAIKLYSDFGFTLLSDPVIGYRKNDLEESLPILEKYMPKEGYDNLQINNAPEVFLEVVRTSEINQF